ncbi:hypothetical protein SDJN02_16772, partial [Cucurbita argyrosperma subsp. argyrosperma]
MMPMLTLMVEPHCYNSQSRRRKESCLKREGKYCWSGGMFTTDGPYPTEADKIALAEATGLHPNQVNNYGYLLAFWIWIIMCLNNLTLRWSA